MLTLIIVIHSHSSFQDTLLLNKNNIMEGIGRKLLIINTNLFLLIYLCVASVDYCAIEKQKCVFATREPHIGCDKTGITFRVSFFVLEPILT